MMMMMMMIIIIIIIIIIMEYHSAPTGLVTINSTSGPSLSREQCELSLMSQY